MSNNVYNCKNTNFFLMKKVLSILLLLFSFVFFGYSFFPREDTIAPTSGVEALTDGEDNVVRCRCQEGFLSNNKCKVTNDFGLCAQSSEGGNIMCSEYNGNC